ncbi:MAG: hypothetical protein ACRD3J_23970, partial [Thermoanaerobaculia bacterium]
MTRSFSVAVALLFAASAGAQAHNDSVPDLAQLAARPQSEMADVVVRFSEDLNSLQRRYDSPDSPAQRPRMRAFYTDWSNHLKSIDFDKLSQEGKVDYVLLNNYFKHELFLMDRQDKLRAETTPLVPFADRLMALQDMRRDLKQLDPKASAAVLAAATKQADSLRALIESPPRPDTTKGAAAKPMAPKVSRTVANRSAKTVDQIRQVLADWNKYYNGYDPLFTWWDKDPYKKLDESLAAYSKTIKERLVGFKSSEATASGGANQGPIVGDPIGAEGLKGDLAYEMIPY